jgi:hypothetical protein
MVIDGERSMLTLHGVPVYVSGMAGHFVRADECLLRLHWRVGDYRISTVGALVVGDKLRTIGAGRWSETFVFAVDDAEGTPEGRLIDGVELATRVAADSRSTRAAERLHYAIADAVARSIAAGRSSADDIRGAVASVEDPG